MKNNKYIYLIICVVILLFLGFYLIQKDNHLNNGTIDLRDVPLLTKIENNNPKEDAKYPVGSYKVFITQYNFVNTNLLPEINIYNAITGEILKPVEKYVYYMYFGTKVSNDTISAYCALNSLSSFHPVDIKSTSNSDLSHISNPKNDPNNDNSINMLLDKDLNNLSFVCIPW